jgi:drug/metabolite transporter (DMT)-like permease
MTSYFRGEAASAYGIGLKMSSVLCMTMMSACIKLLDGAIPAGEIVFVRSLCSIVPLVIWVMWLGPGLAILRTSFLGGHFIRGLSGASGILLNFLALAYLPLTEAITLTYAIPMLTLLFATLWLDEKVGLSRWSGAAMGFIGVLIVVSPHLNIGASSSRSALIGMSFGLLGACCSAFSTIHIRRMSKTENPYTIFFYFSLLTGAFGLVTAIAGWVMPTTAQMLLLLGAGFSGAIGQILFVQCLKHAHASIVAPFEYTSLVWSMILSFGIFSQSPTIIMLVGAAVIAVSGVYMAWSAVR